MAILSSSRLFRAVKTKKPIHVHFKEVDRSRPYIPEHLTQLYHTPYYTLLNRRQQLRYNQLFALRSLEQLMTLEQRIIALIISRVQTNHRVQADNALLVCMQEMIKEEADHYAMFRSLNLKAEPVLYAAGDFIFARLSFSESLIIETLVKMPGVTLFLLWILLILEEFSTHVSREMLGKQMTALGPLEPNFVLAHREHLKDEIRHVSICANLLTILIEQASPINRSVNQWCLKQFMREYLTPKRGGIRVIRRLTMEFPELLSREADMIRCVRVQKQDKVIYEAINSPTAMPVSNQLLQQYPEFFMFGVPGYE